MFELNRSASKFNLSASGDNTQKRGPSNYS